MAIPKISTYPMPTQAPANRVRWTLHAERAVLLVHDMQEYFLDFYDRRAAPVPELLRHTRGLIDLAHQRGVPVVYTAQLPDQSAKDRALLNDMWGPGLTAQPQRKDIVAELLPQAGDTVLDKWRYSAFQRSNLLERMRAQGRDQLIVCGVYAHIGCMLTAAEAFMSDIQPFFVVDALADFSAEEHAQAVHYVSQRCGVSLLTAQVQEQLQEPALTHLPSSLDDLRARIAAQLQLPASDLGNDDNLIDWGLDSIRIMALLEVWRRGGRELSFMQLAEQATLTAWWNLLRTPSSQREAEPA